MSTSEVNLNPKGLVKPINLHNGYTKVATIAFYKAEIRNFESGYELDNRIESKRKFTGIIVKNVHPKPHYVSVYILTGDAMRTN